MSTHQIHVFISHSWKYSGHYNKLSEWIFKPNCCNIGKASLDLRDYSVPKDDPIHHATTDRQLKEAIYAKIQRSHVIVIPTGMYAQYSKWIKKEIDGAIEKHKPILAVDPWGQKRTPSVVSEKAEITVGWNKQSVIDGIWKLYCK